MKKYLSSVLILTLTLTSLWIPGAFNRVIAESTSVVDIPRFDNVYYEDDFSAESINARIVPNVKNSSGASSGTVTVNSGALEISKNSDNYDWCGIDLYLKADKSEFNTGECVVEYTLKRSGNETIQVRPRAGNTGHYSALTWFDGNVHLKYNPGSGETSATIQPDVYVSDTELTVTTYHNFDNGTYSLWLNGNLVLKDVQPLYSSTKNLASLRIYTEQKGATFYLDDVKVSGSEFIAQPDEIPEIGEIYYSQDFSGSETDDRIVPNVTNSAGASSGTVDVNSEALEISKNSDNYDWCGVDLYLKEDKSAYDFGECVVQYTLKRDSGNTVNVRMRSANTGHYAAITWNSNNVHLKYNAGKGETSTTVNSDVYANNRELTITTHHNFDDETYTMWLNGVVVLQDVTPLYSTTKDLASLRIYTEQKGTTFYVDDVLCYAPPAPPEEDAIQKALDELVYDTIFKPSENSDGIIVKDIALPSKGNGMFGADIIWESSNPALVNSLGYVSFADESYDTNPEVELTATVCSGAISAQKSFTVKIAMTKEIYGESLYETESVVYESDFPVEETDLSKNLQYELTQDGGSVTAKDSVLSIVRNEDVNATIADIYANEEHSSLTGYVGVSFTVRKRTKGTFIYKLQKSNNTDFMMMHWLEDGTVRVTASANESGSASSFSAGSFKDRKMKVDVLMNTDKGYFDIWLNNKHVFRKYARYMPVADFYRIRAYIEGASYHTVDIDDIRIVQAIMPDGDVVWLDAEALSDENLLSAPFVVENVIDSDLDLPTDGKNGSSITWKSSDTRYISDDGVITKPTDATDLPEVTMTASFSKGDAVYTKDYVFRVQSNYSTADKMLDAELDYINVEAMMSQGETDPQALTCSLNLPAVTRTGVAFEWKTSNKNVITTSGRVIRPRNDGEPANVTLTAVLTYEGETRERTFDFTVLPDEKWYDPGHMSDEDFYGKWENGEWTIKGKLDYSYSGLSEVEDAVKSGDYEEAKVEFLKYMRIRTSPSRYGSGSRSPSFAEYKTADVHSMQGAKYYAGSSKVDSHEYQPYYISVRADHIARGGSTTYGIVATYNEASEVLVASTRHENEEYRPKIQFTLNGKTVTVDAGSSINIRAGQYAAVNYSDSEDLTVKMFGGFLGDETYKAMINFDFTHLSDEDEVSDVKLIVYAKLKQGYAESKDIAVTYDPYEFSESDTWNSFTRYYYNFNGLKGGTIWDNIPGSDIEYMYQMARFADYGNLMAEYLFTEDEKYAYYMIDTIMSFLYARGGAGTGGTGYPAGFTHYSGWPRTLDTCGRLESFGMCTNHLMKSDYMTPEVCTALMKSVWHMTDSLMHSGASINWIQFEKNAITKVALSIPEYSDSEAWLADAVPYYENLLVNVNNFPDGSYIEKTGGYSQNALSGFINYKNLLWQGNRDVSEAYNEMLLKSAYYNLQLYYPNGQALQWGDEERSVRTSGKYSLLSKWFGDKELEYIDTFGTRGEKPDWTSMQYTGGKITFMRSDWTKNALYMFTQVRGAGGHGHHDDNGVLVMAYQRPLLVDSGIFTYTSDDPNRSWGISTRAHNTVEVNNETQIFGDSGTQDEWVTNESYDFLSQTSLSYVDTPHKRTVMFVKPDLWIVSDLLTPNDESKVNDYKQVWHMLPTAGLTTDAQNNTVSSNFLTGANITIASADDDAEVVEAVGKYDYSYQQLTDAKYAYFQKETSGKATFDTVLLPARSGNPKADVERIDLGVPTSEATAIKFTTEADGEKNTYYYLLDYDHDAKESRTFGKYKTDAHAALVCENSSGKIERVVLIEGSYLKTTSGDTIAEFENVVPDVSVTKSGYSLTIETTKSLLNNAELGFDKVEKVIINSQAVLFKRTDAGLVVITDEVTTVPPATDSSNNKGGIKDKNNSGGSGSGGSGSSGGGGFGPVITPPTDTVLPFDDINSHWAQSYITDLYGRGIVKGDGNKIFRPDEKITRAEFLSMVLRSNGFAESPYQGGFSDVASSDWYSGAVQTSLEKGIISSDLKFRPGDSITREEMCKILVNASGDKLSLVDEGFELSFNDNDKISPWAMDFVKKANVNGLINGRDTGIFDPKSNASRAEAATVISRYLNIAF